MKVSNNTRQIVRRAKLGQIANVGGIAVLGIGLVISLTKPQYSLYTLVLLIVGVVASQYGIVTAYRYARKPRPDEELTSALKGLDDRYKLYNYWLPAYHVLLAPKGLYVFVTRSHAGKVIAEGRKWREERKFSLGRILRLFSPENLGNPVREAEWDRDAMKEWVRQHVDGLQVETEPMVVFLHSGAELDVRNPEVKPVRAKALKEALRRGEAGALGADVYRKLARAFDEVSGETASTANETPSDGREKTKAR